MNEPPIMLECPFCSIPLLWGVVAGLAELQGLTGALLLWFWLLVVPLYLMGHFMIAYGFSTF